RRVAAQPRSRPTHSRTFARRVNRVGDLGYVSTSPRANFAHSRVAPLRDDESGCPRHFAAAPPRVTPSCATRSARPTDPRDEFVGCVEERASCNADDAPTRIFEKLASLDVTLPTPRVAMPVALVLDRDPQV